MNPFPTLFALLLVLHSGSADLRAQPVEAAPADALWQSPAFRRAFTASYGVDARIEPKVSSEEKTVLDAVARSMAANDREGAVGKLRAAPGLNDRPALIFALGNLRFEQGRVDDAVENFTRALELYPNFRDAHRNLAVAHVRRGNLEAARPHLVRALELGARDGLTLGLLGECHARAGHHQPALQAYRLAQLTMPEEGQWKLGEARALRQLDDPLASAEIYRQLLEARATDVGLWLGQADALLQLERREEGIANLEFVRRMDGLGADEIISLGRLYLNEGMVDPGMLCLRNGLQADPPPSARSVVEAIEHLVHARLWPEADVIIKAALGRTVLAGIADPSGRPASSDDQAALASRLTRARALLELETGAAESAAARVEALLARDPLDGEALLLMATFYERQGRPEEAALLFERATRAPEASARAWRAWGQLRVNQGRLAEAVEPLQRALELEEDPALKEYLEAVRRAAELEE